MQPPEVFCKTGVLRNFANFTGKHLCQRLFFKKVFLLKKSLWHRCFLAQGFSCEFCKISKNTFFTEHPRTTGSEILELILRSALDGCECIWLLNGAYRKEIPHGNFPYHTYYYLYLLN